MPTLQEQLQAAVVQTTTDSGLLHNIVHGNAATTVTTENGPVKSIAKVISENQAELASSITIITTKRDEAVAAATAAGESENNAAASESAASVSASAAGTSAAEALASETAAASSEANAANSENAAAESVAAALISETNAAASQSAAALSETNAAASEVAAGNSASSASASAISASSSAADAAASAAAAASSATAPAENSVGTEHLIDGAVTLAKMADGTPHMLVGYNATGQVAETAPPQAFLPGMVMPFAGNAAPAGWLLCDGSVVSRITYAGLFAVIGTAYGAGDGSTTFGLPDVRGRTLIGLDNMGGLSANRMTSSQADVVGGFGGTEMVTPTGSIAGSTGDTTLSTAQIPAHAHPQTWKTSWNNSLTTMMVGTDNNSGCVNAQIGSANGGLSSCGYATNEANMVFTQNRGGGGSHNHSLSATFAGAALNVAQPWLAMNAIIKT